MYVHHTRGERNHNPNCGYDDSCNYDQEWIFFSVNHLLNKNLYQKEKKEMWSS